MKTLLWSMKLLWVTCTQHSCTLISLTGSIFGEGENKKNWGVSTPKSINFHNLHRYRVAKYDKVKWSVCHINFEMIFVWKLWKANWSSSETMEANNNNILNNNNNNQEQRDPLVNVRDRLFHTLFFRLSLAYARYKVTNKLTLTVHLAPFAHTIN